MRRIVLSTLSFLTVFTVSAQIPKRTVQTDSILKRISSAPLNDTVSVPEIDNIPFFNQNLGYKLRLDSIQKVVPLSYNEYVQYYIDLYTKRKQQMGKMMGLSNYYFPIFERALHSYQIPAEIKYLPIIESSMNPHAVSKVGATGMWQFMFGTAKTYSLNMDNFVDERKDPVQASYAAAAYFRDAYEELGDWLLAIAAYNCGKGNVTRAIDKAGSRDFWKIRPFLPKETRDYVPAFIATVYVMNYAAKHDIELKESEINFKTDSIQVNHFIALADVAKAINYEEEMIYALNPSYKKKIVNGTIEAPKRLILPRVTHLTYAKLYDVLNTDISTERNLILASTDDIRDLRKQKQVVAIKQTAGIIYHKVSAGQNLSNIAAKFNIELQDLKVWNSLKSNTIIPGQKLKIYGKATVKVAKPNVNYFSYTVKKGDTLSGIAEKFDGATVDNIKKINSLSKATLQPGMVLKIVKG